MDLANLVGWPLNIAIPVLREEGSTREMAKLALKQARLVDAEVVAFMTEFARFLLDAGVNSAQFHDLAKVGFFEAASAGAKFRNNRVNQSAVAALTGLSRSEVRDLAKRDKLSPKVRSNHLDAIIEGWSSDVRFTGSDFLPRRLSLSGKGSGFSKLVEKYGGDVPAKSILHALQRKGHVRISNGYVYLQPSIRQARGRARLQHASRALHAILQSQAASVDKLSPLRILTMEVSHPAASAKGRIVAQKRAAKSLEALMVDINAAGTAASMESPPSRAQSGWVTRVRVALVAEDSAA